MRTFLEFFHNHNTEDTCEKLVLLKKVLEKGGLQVHDGTHDHLNPFLFVKAWPKPNSFEGIRFYMNGDILSFRVQKYQETQPYGQAYHMDVQKMFEDNILNKKDEKEALAETFKAIDQKVRKFFRDSKKAEDEIVKTQITSMDIEDKTDDGRLNRKPDDAPLIVNPYGGDYSNKVYSKGN